MVRTKSLGASTSSCNFCIKNFPSYRSFHSTYVWYEVSNEIKWFVGFYFYIYGQLSNVTRTFRLDRSFINWWSTYSIQPTSEQTLLDMDWPNEIPADQYLVIECYRKLDPTVYTDVYNDIFLKKYATALIKKQWGANLIKFTGVAMLGGVQMNGETIYSQADEEIKLLEEQLLNGYGLPADMMIG